MNQTAQVIKFERLVVKADVNEGFDRVAGKLTDTLNKPPVSLPERERQIIGVVISKTYRYHKKWDWISREQFSEATGITDLSNITKLINSLVAKKVLIKDSKKIAINTIISEWREIDRVTRNPKKVTGDPIKKSHHQPLEKSLATTEKLPATRTEVASNPHNRKTILQKTILQKTIQSIDLPKGLTFISWCEFIQNRIDLNKPFTELAATKFLNRIEKQISEGMDATSLIDEAISNGWQTTYPPKQNKFQPQGNFQSGQKLSPVGQSMAARLANMSDKS
jgi:phage replication O-like protein O